MPAKKIVEIIGVPMDLGADRRGVDMGPSAMRYAGLLDKVRGLGHKVEDTGNIDVPIVESVRIEYPNAKYLSEVRKVCLLLSRQVTTALRSNKFPVLLGGDHSIAIGTLAGIYNAEVRTSRKRGKDTTEFGMIWLDAHADFNTPEISPSGNIHGMSVALSSGQGSRWFPAPEWPKRSVDPKRIVIVGARQIDPDERTSLRTHGVKVYSMADIDRIGMKSVMGEAIDLASNHGRTKNIHVSFDIDVVDPQDAPGVGTPVRGGITYREAHLAMEMISESGLMRSLEMVEVNPILDQQNSTAELAVELILSAMGKRII
ncbi:MAG: arginase [Nitrososphaerales archaeon]